LNDQAKEGKKKGEGDERALSTSLLRRRRKKEKRKRKGGLSPELSQLEGKKRKGKRSRKREKKMHFQGKGIVNSLHRKRRKREKKGKNRKWNDRPSDPPS